MLKYLKVEGQINLCSNTSTKRFDVQLLVNLKKNDLGRESKIGESHQRILFGHAKISNVYLGMPYRPDFFFG